MFSPNTQSRVQSRINLAKGPTRFTPQRKSGYPVSAGLDHVIKGHFGGNNAHNAQSQFTLTVDSLKNLLQSPKVVNTPVQAIQLYPGGPTMWMREVDVGYTIGTTRLSEGGLSTRRLRVFTDDAGNLITTFPIP